MHLRRIVFNSVMPTFIAIAQITEIMNQKTLALTQENEELNRKLAQFAVEFLDLFTRHKEMVEDESVILNALYLEKLGCFQLELLQKRTEAAQLKMKMQLIQAAINRDEQPDLQAIENSIQKKFQEYFAEIESIEPCIVPEKVLTMKREPDNKFDKFAIALYCDDIRIGFVPAAMNMVCSRLMDAGKLFICRVVTKNRIDTWLQIDANIYMVD